MKNIQNIAPLLAVDYLDIEINPVIFERNQKLVADNAQRLGLYHKYLGLLHDSLIIKSNITNDKFSILLNDFTTHVFSDVLVSKKKLKLDHDKLVFPIQLDFEIEELTFNSVDDDGYIHEINPTHFHEYLFEEIISINQKIIEIGLELWKDNKNNNNPGQRILILLKAKNIILTELQDSAWKALFGNSYDNYYQYFKSQLATGRYLSDQSNCYDLFDEFEREQDN